MNFKRKTLFAALSLFFAHNVFAMIPSDEQIIDGFKDNMGEVSVKFTNENTYVHFLEKNLLIKGDLYSDDGKVNISKLVKEKHNKNKEEVSQEEVYKKELDSDKKVRIDVYVDLSNAEKVQARTLDIISKSIPNSNITLPREVAKININEINNTGENNKNIREVKSVDQLVVNGESSYNKNPSNLSDEEKLRIELKRINNELIKDEQSIVYKAKNEKYSITVFTDITCPFCKRFHNDELPKLNAAGVTVRYLMYPRAGLQSEAAQLMAGAVCSSNPNNSLNILKNGGLIERKNVDCSPKVELGYRLGKILQIPGTPTIITQHGDFLPGLMPAQRLIDLLNKK